MGTRDRDPPWFDPPDESVYVIINTINHNTSAADQPIFAMLKWLVQWFPKTEEAKPRRDGSILALAKTRGIAENAVKNANDFYGKCHMKIEPMDNMNRCQGVIFSRGILSETTENLVKDLQNEQVTNIERIQSWKNNVLSPNSM
jgi:hypothetical protein